MDFHMPLGEVGKFGYHLCHNYHINRCLFSRLAAGRSVTIHLWEELRTVWISGDGKREWYNTVFQELYADASNDRLPGKSYAVVNPGKGKRPCFFLGPKAVA